MSPKALGFYIGMLMVLLLVVWSVIKYGSTYLEAPEDISGQYIIDLAESPQCVDAAILVLVIEQSGSYLTADLIRTDSREVLRAGALKGNGTFSGQLKGNQIWLTRLANDGGICHSDLTMRVEATIEHSRLRGQLEGSTFTIPIVGQRSTNHDDPDHHRSAHHHTSTYPATATYV